MLSACFWISVKEDNVNNQQWQNEVERIYSFHTKRAPGVPIGACMIDYARELLGPITGTINAVCETGWCLADAIQVMTGCTVGNRYLRIEAHLGRYALTLFDRDTGEGIRVYVDVRKIDANKTPELYKFFHRTRGAEVEQGGTPRQESNARVHSDFAKVHRDILSWERVVVRQKGKQPIPPAAVCPGCGESFLGAPGSRCDVCTGQTYYDRSERSL